MSLLPGRAIAPIIGTWNLDAGVVEPDPAVYDEPSSLYRAWTSMSPAAVRK
ncbi:hypothetical protein [Actinomadura sp. NBRC 104412]|uniref:hypothetical protein n=1 Tax=Actinomadura sp. NBRC 104412 TaxID=3032203 RepID=UPI0025577190|nr:hypothetical protein [Actinomadura sp. NBRC 104412]